MHAKRTMMKFFGTLLVAALLLAALPAGEVMAQATITVCASGCDHTTIQAAVSAANAGDTIEVAAGTYEFSGPMTVDMALTIIGADKATTFIKPTTGFSNEYLFRVVSGGDLELSNFTMDGEGFSVKGGVAIADGGIGTIDNNIIKNMSYGKYTGFGVITYGDDAVISNNTFSNIARVGMWVGGIDVVVAGNTYTGKGAGDYLDYGVEVGFSGSATITGNTITNCLGIALSDGSGSGAILVSDHYGKPVSAVLENNTLTNSSVGLLIGYSEDDESVVTASGNTFMGNEYQIDAMSAFNIDLEAALADNAFDKAVWIDGGLIIYTSIQDAIDAADPGDTVHVGPGTYNEAILADNKALTLLGSGEDVTIIDGTGLTDNTLFKASGLTSGILDISGFTFKDDPTSNAAMTYLVSLSGCQEPAKINFHNNTLVGTGSYDYDWGLLAGYNGSCEMVINENTFDNIGGNSILLERATGSVEISYNEFKIPTDGGPAVFSMSYGTAADPNTVIGKHWYHNNHFYPKTTGSTIWSGIVVAPAWGTGWDVRQYGTYEDVVIENNIVESFVSVGIQVEVDGTESTFNGVIQNNVLTAYPDQPNSKGIRLLGSVSDTTLSRNIITNGYRGIWLSGTWGQPVYPSGITVEYNQLADNVIGYEEQDTLAEQIATPNWWGSILGPETGYVENNDGYSPWCGDAACSFLVYDGPVTDGFYVQDGKLILSGNINVPDGIELGDDGLNVFLKKDTIVANSSPGFIVTGDNITIEGEYPGEEHVNPSDSSAGIEVNPDVQSLYIINLDFDGTNTSGPAIRFNGDVYGTQIVNNIFRNFANSGIVFGGEEKTEHVIQGNMFMSVGTPAISSGTTAIDAAYNSWGENAAPAITNVTTEPFTHVDLWVESSGAFSGYQVAKGETITFSVMADMTNITGAEFELTYPADLLTLGSTTAGDDEFVGIPDGSSGTQDLLNTSNPGKIMFRGIVPLGDPAVTGEVALFTATFTANETLTGSDILEFIEIVQGFSMSPTGYTNHVYPAGFADGEVTVIDLPTIDSDDIQGYYLVGDTQEFNVTTVNPANGGDFTNVLFYIEVEAEDGDITLFQYDAGGTWLDITLDCTTTPGVCVGTFGPAGGFPMGSNYDVTTAFQVRFADDGTFPAVVTLKDVTADAVLTTFDTTIEGVDPVVYTKPTIASDDIDGPYTALIPKDFTLTIADVDADMITDGVVETGLLFDFPEGTVVTHDSVDYTCTASGCDIPMTLTSPTGDFDFTVTFPGEFDGDITVTLLDTAWPDRELASETFGVTVYANWSAAGKVTMQGRTYRGDIPMTLTGLELLGFGPFAEASLNQMGTNIFFSDIAEGYYVVTTGQDRYLNVPGAMLVVDKDITLPDLYLYGGNANNDDAIEIGDASIIGGAYGSEGDPLTLSGDVNFDGRINIQDLALVGGNYLLDESVYDDWLIPYGIQGQVLTDEYGQVTGNLTGNYNITITGEVTEYVNNQATFSGTVAGDINGSVTATVNENGTGTLFGTLTEDITSEVYQILGIFPKSGTNGHFVGTIVQEHIPTITGVTITAEGDAASVAEGDTLQMYAAVTPAAAYDRVIWSVWSDTGGGTATIDPITGLLTGVSEGDVVVIAKALDGSLLDATKTITVTAP